MIHKIKNVIAKFLWRNNQWAKAVDDIENAVKELRKGEIETIELRWKFTFLKTPPSNKFTAVIKLG